MTIEIRTLTPADLDMADALLMAAYGGASRKQRLQSYLTLQPDGWILAHWDGTPAGVAGATHYGPIAYIGLVGVHPAYQRRGIAMAMMRHLLRWSAERGRPVLQLDASPAGAPLYERLGFVDDESTRPAHMCWRPALIRTPATCCCSMGSVQTDRCATCGSAAKARSGSMRCSMGWQASRSASEFIVLQICL